MMKIHKFSFFFKWVLLSCLNLLDILCLTLYSISTHLPSNKFTNRVNNLYRDVGVYSSGKVLTSLKFMTRIYSHLTTFRKIHLFSIRSKKYNNFLIGLNKIG